MALAAIVAFVGLPSGVQTEAPGASDGAGTGVESGVGSGDAAVEPAA